MQPGVAISVHGREEMLVDKQAVVLASRCDMQALGEGGRQEPRTCACMSHAGNMSRVRQAASDLGPAPAPP